MAARRTARTSVTIGVVLALIGTGCDPDDGAAVAPPPDVPTTDEVTDDDVSDDAPPDSVTEVPRTTLGVTDDEIHVVYYWRGEGTGGSQFLGDEDILVPEEAEAFAAFVNYLNEHSGTGATFLGFPFDLHGRRLTVDVLEGGTSPEQFLAVAERIAVEIEPFAAVAGEGSISSYACPRFAEVGIFSIATLPIQYDLDEASNGYCLPVHQAWETQVELVASFLEQQAAIPYQGEGDEEPRVYGIVHTEHPTLLAAAPRLVERLEATGATIATVVTLPADLTVAQQQTANVISRLRAAGVNTVIMPDAGVPLTLTRAAGSQDFHPDYVVWPCSGMDLAGMGRLFQEDQWARAEGVTCYDDEYNVDIARDSSAADTEWYQHYRLGSEEEREPPLNTELVYLSMFPLVVGITNAGPDLTADSFLAGLDDFEPYRYSVRDGRADDPSRMLVSMGSDRGLLGDGTRVRWDVDHDAPGSPLPGGYIFPDDERLAPAGRS